jgi:hypothetical protein
MEQYSKPAVLDYGDLQTLTSDCIGGEGGDSRVPGGELAGYGFGTDTSTCQSK